MRRSVVFIAQIGVSVNLQNTDIMKFFGVGANDGSGNGMFRADQTKKFFSFTSLLPFTTQRPTSMFLW